MALGNVINTTGKGMYTHNVMVRKFDFSCCKKNSFRDFKILIFFGIEIFLFNILLFHFYFSDLVSSLPKSNNYKGSVSSLVICCCNAVTDVCYTSR